MVLDLKLVYGLVFSLGCLLSMNIAHVEGSEKVVDQPSHHTADGFKNNYLPKERMSKSLTTVFKWRFTRNSQENVTFETVEPDLAFLKTNQTEETLTWIGHSTFLWQYRG